MNPGLAVQQAMRDALLARPSLLALLGGAHVFDEPPRGAHPPYVVFEDIETRDWSVMEEKAHEHFFSIEVATGERSRRQAQAIVDELDAALDRAALTLDGHRLINLRLAFWTVARNRSGTFGARLRFRAATEPA